MGSLLGGNMHRSLSALNAVNAAAKVLAMIFLSQVSPAWADDPVVQIGNPTYQGSGCPDGTVSATLSPDATALSLIFDKYSVETGKSASGVVADRKQCSFQIPMTLPAGYSVTVMRVDYRGYRNLPAGAFGSFQAGFSFRDRRRAHAGGPDVRQAFRGPAEGDFFITQNSNVPEWSECDGDVQLRLDTALDLRSSRHGELATVSIDSADLTGERQVQYVLAWRRCNGPELHPGQAGHPIGPHGGPRGNGMPGLGGRGSDQMPSRGAPGRGEMGRGRPMRR
jgi:hypothetical protein